MFSKTFNFLLLERADLSQPFACLVKGRISAISASFLLLFMLTATPVLTGQNAYTNDDVDLAFQAVEHGNEQVLELLLSQGVPLESTTYDRRSLLIAAAHHQRPEIARMLAERGAEIDYIARDGYTALMEACEHGVEDLVRYLEEKGADVNLADRNEHTALMLAAENGHKEIVEYLLANGADRTAIAHDDWTAYDHALLGGYDDIAILIGEEHAGVYKDGQRPNNWNRNSNRSINRNTNRVTRNGRTMTTTTTTTNGNGSSGTVININPGDQVYQGRGRQEIILGDDWPSEMSNLSIETPIADFLSLSMDVDRSIRFARIELQNRNEEPVLQIHNGRLGSGGHNFNFDIDELPKRTYWLYIEMDEEAHRIEIGRNTEYPWR